MFGDHLVGFVSSMRPGDSPSMIKHVNMVKALTKQVARAGLQCKIEPHSRDGNN